MSTHAAGLEFGRFRLDPARRLLWKGGELLAVTPKAIELLNALVEQPGEVVGKQDLLAKVWPNTFVEEANLSVNVSALRKVLGRQKDGRPYIETVSRRGYRFVGRSRSVARALRSLAVLPFQPIGAAPTDDFLGLGMADAIITRLGRVGPLEVRPTASVVPYAGAGLDPRQAGRELGVDAVLACCVQRDGTRVRATVQLLGVSDGVTLWADAFDQGLNHIFDVQEAIAGRLARALSIRLSLEGRERRTERPTANLKAYDAFLRGRYFWNKLSGPWLEKARDAFEEAIARDPTFARAHAGLADTYVLLGLYGLRTPREAWPRARTAAEKAVRMDEDLAEGHVSLAYVRLFQDWAWGEAEKEIEKALTLDPASATVRQWWAVFLGMTGRFPEALEEIRRAQELEPLSLSVRTTVGFELYLSNRGLTEIEQHRRTLELEPDYAVGHWALGLAYEQKRMYAAAIKAFDAAVRLSGGSILMKSNLARAHALAGRKKEARRLLRELATPHSQAMSPYRIATVHAALGDVEATLRWLEEAARLRDHWMVWLQVDPMLDSVRENPRFESVRAKVGFPFAGFGDILDPLAGQPGAAPPLKRTKRRLPHR